MYLESVGVQTAINISTKSASGPLTGTRKAKVLCLQFFEVGRKPMRIFFVLTVVSCKDVNICHSNARCVLNSAANNKSDEYLCQCNRGFTGDGFQCTPHIGQPAGSPATGSGDRESCDVIDNCGPHATCIYDDEILRSVCVCDDGYRGDGFTCTLYGKILRRCYCSMFLFLLIKSTRRMQQRSRLRCQRSVLI